MGKNIVSGPVIGRWVMDKMGGQFSSDTSTAIGLQKDDGSIVAGVAYENWNGRSIVAHMSITGLITRKFLWAIFDYAYRKCGVEKVILPVESDNARSIKFVGHLGFTEEARIADAGKTGDIILFTLRKRDCKFLGDAYGQA